MRMLFGLKAIPQCNESSLILLLLFFDIFFLPQNNDLVLGNSIWHSVRVNAISKDAADELPDNIGDWLFCRPVVLDNSYALLQLDKDGGVGVASVNFG